VPTFGPPALLADLNSTQGDTYAPTVTGDNQELLANANWPFDDPTVHIYSALWDPSNGGSFTGLGSIPIINGQMAEGDPTLDSDGLVLVFSSQRDPGYGARDLWTSARKSRGNLWSAPTLLDALSTAEDESSPSLSPDGKTLFFTRGPATSNASSLYMSTRIGDAGADAGATWGPPQKVMELDYPGSMTDYSTLFPDERTILFSSDRATPGTHHLFLARRATAGSPFVCIQQLGSPLSDNSVEELSPFVTRDGKKLYYGAREPGATTLELRQSLVRVGP
jgi:Tol biopolymer transport system component